MLMNLQELYMRGEIHGMGILNYTYLVKSREGIQNKKTIARIRVVLDQNGLVLTQQDDPLGCT